MKLCYFSKSFAGHQESRQTLNLWAPREGPLGPKVELSKVFCCSLDRVGERKPQFWYRDPTGSVSSKADVTLDRRKDKG